MGSLPIQRICLALVFSLYDVTASNTTTDTGNYTTVVTPQSWNKQNNWNQIYIKVNDSQVVNITRSTITVGESVKFDCEALGSPTSVFEWQKNGKPLGEVSYQFESLASFNSPQLQLENVLPPDSGQYTCIVINGNVTQRKSFILHVLERQEIMKPRIKTFLPKNLTITVGGTVNMQCLAERQYNDTLPFVKLMKYIRITARVNGTKDDNVTERTENELARIKKRRIVNPYMNRNYDIIKDGNKVTILETLNVERSLSVQYKIDHVEMTDAGVFSCIVFNEVGFSKETIYLYVIPPPTPSVYDLALAYAAKYSDGNSKEQIPLAVTICLPVMLLVVLIIGFIWWKENIKIKSKEEKLSLIKIKKLREMDNFSSLEHMGKFSSRMETKRSSFVSEGVGSGIVDDHYDHHSDYNDSDCDNQAHNRLLGNGHTNSLSVEVERRNGSAKTPEVIPLQDMGPTTPGTPATARSSAFGSHSELEWEPFDLKLNAPTNSELSQVLDTSA